MDRGVLMRRIVQDDRGSSWADVNGNHDAYAADDDGNDGMCWCPCHRHIMWCCMARARRCCSDNQGANLNYPIFSAIDAGRLFISSWSENSDHNEW